MTKKEFFRFLKEHKIYSFITSEVKKDYHLSGGWDRFFEIIRVGENAMDVYPGVFNSYEILSFHWGSMNEFWKHIDHEWRIYVRKLNNRNNSIQSLKINY